MQDHTSILRFIERKWNIGAMTFRDANAADMTDYFDFKRKPAFLKPPHLAAAPRIGPGLDGCHAIGLHPPGEPGVPVSSPSSAVFNVSTTFGGDHGPQEWCC